MTATADAARTATSSQPSPAGARARLDAPFEARLGRRVAARSGAERHTTVSPLDGAAVGTVPLSTVDDVALAFEDARRAQLAWARTSPRERARVLLRFHDLVASRRDEALDLVQWESGKVRKHALEEVLDVFITARYYARTAPGLLAPKRRKGAVPALTSTVELRHPKGVVGIIPAWNYPLALAVNDALTALVAGNAVVLKPDLQTPFSALWAADLLAQAGLPDGLFQVVVGEGPVLGPALVDHADFVMFTGSTRTGREVAQRAAGRLVGCSLELGGKNSFMVLDDADVPRTVEAALRSCFSSAGQLCISTERVLVQDGIWDDFVPAFLRAVEGMRLSTDVAWGGDMGSLVSQRQLDVVERHVAAAKAAGASVLAGGQRRPEIGPLVFEPTVLADVPDTCEVWQEETFGPVVTLRRFGSDDEGVALANDTSYGLNGVVWTSDLRRGRAVAARVQAGTVAVNETYAATWGSIDAPMGGMKQSGLGRRHGSEGLLKYTEAQTVSVQRALGFGGPSWMTDERWGETLVRVTTTMRRIPRWK